MTWLMGVGFRDIVINDPASCRPCPNLVVVVSALCASVEPQARRYSQIGTLQSCRGSNLADRFAPAGNPRFQPESNPQFDFRLSHKV